MSVDINWETLTGGDDGLALAETIRAFIHERFQHVTFPRFIRSVHVHAFNFGTVCPEVEIIDICDPLPDFYEEDESESESDSEEENEEESTQLETEGSPPRQKRSGTPAKDNKTQSAAFTRPPAIDTKKPLGRLNLADQLGSPFLSRTGTPGIPGGTSNINLSYFHLPLGVISGPQTPLAAFGGGSTFQNGRNEQFQRQLQRHANVSSIDLLSTTQSRTSQQSPSTIEPPSPPRSSTADSASASSQANPPHLDPSPMFTTDPFTAESSPHPMHEKRPEDLQIVFRTRYSGNVRIVLTAEILLDYPMPSFVGIPLQLNITGLTFDGIAVLAYIRKKAHFCFMSPEDAHVLIGTENGLDDELTRGRQPQQPPRKKAGGIGGLLQEIKVESEIGQKGTGNQVLKNVGKVERFVLEQVRRIFENELVYPSFWTFLV
ncbi:MAG: Mitochondrial distribution and morphology protein 12 [Cirrosporium novae-zelandiae]|nr:MAG: Mitochondrial distribution and morphology protein 12 [Cirrosporium novae-zelandiae]